MAEQCQGISTSASFNLDKVAEQLATLEDEFANAGVEGFVRLL